MSFEEFTAPRESELFTRWKLTLPEMHIGKRTRSWEPPQKINSVHLVLALTQTNFMSGGL